MPLLHVSRTALGSEFSIYLGGEDAAALETLGYAALDRVLWVEQQLSHFLPDSEISQINQRAYSEPVPLSPSLFSLLLRLRRWSEVTEGAFDPTAGKLVRLWGFFRRGQVRGEPVAPPEPALIERIVPHIGWRNVELNEIEPSIRFLTPEVELHLGAVGKGYIVQSVADYLREQGVSCALLHSGYSSIVAVGSPPDSEGWPVGIPDPQYEERLLATVTLADAALTTSGTAEQYVTVEGRAVSHLFDPRTGYPVNFGRTSPPAPLPDARTTRWERGDNNEPVDSPFPVSAANESGKGAGGLGTPPLLRAQRANRERGSGGEVAPAARLVRSISVLSRDAAEGDALSTAFFVQGEEWTRRFVYSRPDIGVVWIDSETGCPEKEGFRAFGNVNQTGMRLECVE